MAAETKQTGETKTPEQKTQEQKPVDPKTTQVKTDAAKPNAPQAKQRMPRLSMIREEKVEALAKHIFVQLAANPIAIAQKTPVGIVRKAYDAANAFYDFDPNISLAEQVLPALPSKPGDDKSSPDGNDDDLDDEDDESPHNENLDK